MSSRIPNSHVVTLSIYGDYIHQFGPSDAAPLASDHGITPLSGQSLRFPLGADEVEAYHLDEVIGPYRLVSPDVMAEMRERIMDEIIIPGEQLDDPHVDYHDRHLDHEAVCRLCRGPELVDRIASLIGARPADLAQQLPGQAAPWPRPPATSSATPRCRGTRTAPTSICGPRSGGSAWIAVTEATVDNGCLQVVRGSHTSMFNHDVDDTRHSFHQAVPADAIDPDDIAVFELEPGEFVLFSEYALHGSGPNRTAQPRIGLSPRVTVPFVRVTGNPLYAGRDRARHAPDEPRQMGLLRGPRLHRPPPRSAAALPGRLTEPENLGRVLWTHHTQPTRDSEGGSGAESWGEFCGPTTHNQPEIREECRCPC